MKRLVALLLLLASPVAAKPLPALRLIVPLLGDVVRAIPPAAGGSGGGGSNITIGSTGVSGGTDGRLLFQASSFVSQDSDLTFLTDTLTATKIVGSTSITDSGLTAGRMTFAGAAGILADDSDCTFATDTLTCTKIIGSTSITDTGLTAGRLTFAGTAGLLADDSDCTFATDTLTCTKIGSSSFTGTNVHTGQNTFGSAAAAANAVDLGETAGQITFEGATADAFEGRLGWTDPTVGDQVILLPNLGAATTDTIMTLATAQTVTAQKIFGLVRISDGSYILMSSGQGGNGPSMMYETALTPDSQTIGTGSLANSIHIIESADGVGAGYDFQNCSAGTSASTNPILCIHSNSQSTTKWVDFQHNDTNGQIKVGSGGLILPGMIGTAGTVPAVSNTTANSCGTTTATITGTDATGAVVVGATAGTSCTLTFNVAAPTRRQCWCSNETTLGNLCNTAQLTTSTTKIVGTFVAGDTVNYGCLTY